MDTAVKGIIIKGNKFLLLKQNVDNGFWYSLPGGRVQNSDFESEIKREIKEETSLDIEVVNYVGDWFFIRESNGMKTMCKTFVCESISEELDSSNSEEYEDVIDFVWLTKNEFLEGDYVDNESLLDLFRGLDF